jgi:hypothetical protein
VAATKRAPTAVLLSAFGPTGACARLIEILRPALATAGMAADLDNNDPFTLRVNVPPPAIKP